MDSGAIQFSYDTLGRSVRILWKNKHGEEILDVFREGATRMAVQSDKGATYISLDFHMGESAGRMEIRVLPNMAVKDQLLFA